MKSISRKKLIHLCRMVIGADYFIRNKEKRKRTAELEKLAAQLVIANKELLFQNEEKEKQAAELVIANKELLFQNHAKEIAGLERIQSEQRLVRAQELAHMGCWELSLATNTLICSGEACRIYGIASEQHRMSFRSWLSFIYPDDLGHVLMKIKESRDSKKGFSFHHRIIHKDGVVRYVYVESKLEFDLTLQPSALHGIVKDETEIKTAEDQIEFDRNNLSALINNTDDMMWSVGKDLKLITFNQAFGNHIMTSTGRHPLKGDPILSYGGYKEGSYERALEGEAFMILDHLEQPAETWTEVSFHPLRKGDQIIGTACFSRDVTQRTKNENSIRAMEQEMLDQIVQEQKTVTRAILNAQEKERNHIGQELHDNISQILVSSKLYLGAAGAGNETIKELIKYPLELIDSSIEEIRLLSSRHVTPIKNVDLRDLLQTLLNKLQENSSIDTALQYDVSNRELNDDLKLNIYRIIQEQINNIVKHAAPGRVDISVQAEPKSLHIEMTDDGKGFDITKKRNGIGLQNMLNRIDSFNGKMDIESSPGKGCKIQIAIPY